MNIRKPYDLRHLLTVIFVAAAVMLSEVFFSCAKSGKDSEAADRESLRQVLYVQSLYNHNTGEGIVPEITEVIDSMRIAGRNPYYFAAVNILIDRLFSVGRFAEADSLAVRMEEEALEDNDSLSMAMAKRVRAQMFYKLSQPERALSELKPATSYIADPYRTDSDFGTATSIREWLWIISREIGDTAAMNEAGKEYARMVGEYNRINGWIDSTGHYSLTSLAFLAEEAFSKGETLQARALLDSAGKKVLPSLPSRAYEHLYAVRSNVSADDNNWEAAIADADTLLAAHKDFPWFYQKDLLLKAQILTLAGRHEEGARAYSEYVVFHDSLSNKITDKRLHDLTVLYRTEIDREQKRAARFRIFALGAAFLLLFILLALSLLLAAKEKKRNRLLVERLKELDLAAETAFQNESMMNDAEITLIDRLDRHMLIDRPYTDPSLNRKELAEFCGLSSEALGQLIREEKGMSVRTYINSFRLEEARRILGSDSEESINDLAVRLGFGTSRTLQRAFKERYDMSPTQYRNASLEIDTLNNQ